MEHRKRKFMQQKVELSTLLKIVLAKKKNKRLQKRVIDDRTIVTALATDAIEALKNGDLQTVIKNDQRWTILKEDEAAFF